jgi:hypothetical protein
VGPPSPAVRRTTEDRRLPRVNRQRSGKQQVRDGDEREGQSAKSRLWPPLGRFLAWWAGLFAFLSAFSVCPICGQPGCVGGPAAAGILGGVSAFVLSMLRLNLRRRKPGTCGRHDAPPERSGEAPGHHSRLCRASSLAGTRALPNDGPGGRASPYDTQSSVNGPSSSCGHLGHAG